MVATSSFLTGLKTEGVDVETTPKVMLGAASPLWLMFGGAAMAGATWWWWSNRWRESVNLEALMALRPEPVAPSAPADLEEPVAPALASAPAATLFDAVEPVIQATVAAVEDTLDAVTETVEAIVEAAPTPVEVLEPVVEPAAELAAETVETAEAVADDTAETITAAAEPIVETAQAVQEAVVEAAVATVDDLTRLVGIGPKLAAALADRGVTSFAQIAAWGDADLAEVDKALDLKGRAARDAWVAQAKRLAEGATA
ncbi:MAG: hypothetical protein JWP92_1640 [Caulobacter sp.]|nr:hypothetical protein [Caulobacter sp.]